MFAWQVVSEAARQLPEEVYRAPAKAEAGEEQPQGRLERKRRRAASKRQFKKRESQVSPTNLSHSRPIECIDLNLTHT